MLYSYTRQRYHPASVPLTILICMALCSFDKGYAEDTTQQAYYRAILSMEQVASNQGQEILMLREELRRKQKSDARIVQSVIKLEVFDVQNGQIAPEPKGLLWQLNESILLPAGSQFSYAITTDRVAGFAYILSTELFERSVEIKIYKVNLQSRLVELDERSDIKATPFATLSHQLSGVTGQCLLESVEHVAILADYDRLVIFIRRFSDCLRLIFSYDFHKSKWTSVDLCDTGKNDEH
jgi:hypothetical protein